MTTNAKDLRQGRCGQRMDNGLVARDWPSAGTQDLRRIPGTAYLIERHHQNHEADRRNHRRPGRAFDKAHDLRLAGKVNRREIMIETNLMKVECV